MTIGEGGDFDIEVFEAATARVARQLAFFRTDGANTKPTDNERLTAGHLVGGLYAGGFIRKPPQGHPDGEIARTQATVSGLQSREDSPLPGTGGRKPGANT